MRLLASLKDFADALDQVSWAAVHALPNSSSRQRLLFHRVKGLRLSGWDMHRQQRGCPDSGATGGDAYHIVWSCPSAQRLWRTDRSWWASLGFWARNDSGTEHDFFTAVFSLRLPGTPPKVWDMTPLSQRPAPTHDAPDGPFPALQAAWQQIVLETLVVILGLRRSRFDQEQEWSTIQTGMMHDVGCHNILGTLIRRSDQEPRVPTLHAPLLRELRAAFDAVRPTALTAASQPPPLEVVHVLYFDEGSRGNPGPGGSGAVVVRVVPGTGDQEVAWSAAMSHAHPSTTNNQAEYHGLLTGLRAAHHHRWPYLEVVGDSALILWQLSEYRPPKNHRLLRLYSEARRLADQVGVCHWTHQVRAFNKIADSLANLAMDTAASSQLCHPTARSGHMDIHAHLSNDIRPSMAASLGRRVDLSVMS